MTSAVRKTKPERIEARLTAEQKEYFQRAAHLSGRSLTDFLVWALQKLADETIRSHQLMELSARDSQFLADMLLNPPEPSEPALRYARRYERPPNA